MGWGAREWDGEIRNWEELQPRSESRSPRVWDVRNAQKRQQSQDYYCKKARKFFPIFLSYLYSGKYYTRTEELHSRDLFITLFGESKVRRVMGE